MNGMQPIINKLKSVLLGISEKSAEQVRIEGLCVRAIKAVMNNPVGLKNVAQIKDAVKVITLCLGSKTIDERLKVCFFNNNNNNNSKDRKSVV